MKILVSANAAWNLVNYRAGLLQQLVRAGHEVVAAAPRDGSVAALQALGVRFIGFPMVGRGTVPEEEWALYRRYRRLLVAERPRAYLGFTIKPNVWGAFAARRAGVAPLLTVTGLGTVFGRKTPVNLAARTLYAGALSLAKTVFFQNASDAARLSRVTGRRAEVLPGSGVDLTHFAPPTRASSGRHFLFLGRLLRQKGVFEFVEAATAVRARYPDARFTLLGAPSADVGPPMLEAFGAAGVDYGCALADVRPAIAAADCLVLPSAYGEGTPHSLLEGAAMGRALIASDHPGCRDAVRPDISGFLVPPRDGVALAAAMMRFCALAPAARAAMGAAGRTHMEVAFDERFVVARYEAALARL